MRTFKTPDEFLRLFTYQDCRDLNPEKAAWYDARPYMDYGTKAGDFLDEAIKAGAIETAVQP